ncbi:Endoribonuclease L-PSP/chorismate mutase-like protein [Zopfochytrium polystomum]|nr:Endoribonuclease L-PSP/chorismate mutase-like protein [Zopfochytrium polystomum]
MAASSPSVNGESFLLADRAGGLANYPHARRAGGMIFVSGISSRRPDNTWEGVKENPDGTWELDIAAQTRAVIQNIEAILKAAGAGLEHLVDLTVFLVDMKDYAKFNEVYNTFFPEPTRGPTRTTVAVKQLPNPRLLIEIKAVALAPN